MTIEKHVHTVVYALLSHSDIAKFELEDGLVRHAAATLLDAPSTISQITVDIATSGVFDSGSPHHAPAFDAMFQITAESVSDVRPANLENLLGDVVGISGAWAVSSSVVAGRDDAWIGHATPGVKLVALLTSGPGIDRGSYDGWLRDAVMTCAEDLEGVGVAYHTPLETLIQGTGFDSMLGFSFPTKVALEETLDAKTLDSVLGSELLDSNQTLIFTAVEHRLTPNENAWEMHSSMNQSPDT